MTTYDFDTIIDRRGTDCVKYDIFDSPDLLSLWVADMDFAAPPAVVEALTERLQHPIFGYTMDMPRLREAICERLARLYNWQVTPDEIVFLPGVVAALHASMRAVSEPGDNVLIHTPIYPPFLASPEKNRLHSNTVPLMPVVTDGILRYEIDFDAFEAAINDGTKLFALCSPHNPTGRIWTPDELRRMAEICIAHDVVICSDEIHADLVFEPHTPMATLSPEIAQNTITLMAPSKTYNIPSLGFSFAVIQNADLRARCVAAEGFVVPHVGVLGYTAALGAYTGGDEWLAQVIDYLRENRDLTTRTITEHMPQIIPTHPEGTYLTWLDCRALPALNGDADAAGSEFLKWIEPFFLKQANVALNNGLLFGEDGVGFARLNFALPRSQLREALERMRRALEAATG
ncbi:MAG: PatB family C-S lyase [Cyclobacteriaceae bacterium]|nr:PatB family C-S lyase [Cyclobacteriaceae bacterium]